MALLLLLLAAAVSEERNNPPAPLPATLLETACWSIGNGSKVPKLRMSILANVREGEKVEILSLIPFFHCRLF